MRYRFSIGGIGVGGTAGGIVGRIAGALFGLVFAGFGLLFIGFMGYFLFQDTAKESWAEVRCRIVSSEVVPASGAGGGFEAVVRFETTTGGRTITGTHQEHDESYTAALAVVERHRPGETIMARQNPANREEIVLRPAATNWGKLLILPFMLIPFVFVAVGAAIAWSSLRGERADESAARPISAKAEGPGTRRLGFIFGLVFGLMFAGIGVGATWVVLLHPALMIMQARSWNETTCTVELSRVVSSSDGDGSTTYRPEILYRYEIGGRTYRSSRVTFFGGSSSGRNGKEEVVRRYPVGREAVAFVNPSNPAESVLIRSATPMMFFGLLTLVFLVIGVAVLVATFRGLKKSKSGAASISSSLRAAPRHATSPGAGMANDESLTLKPAASPAAKVFGTLFFCLFWNGIVSVFVGQFITSWRRGPPEWFMGIFMIPFVLMGLFLFGWFLCQLLALANPRPTLQIAPGTPRTGGRFRIRWNFSGAVERMDRVRLFLVGRESATYTRGTTTSTDHSVFLRMPILDTADRAEMRAGETEVAAPSDAAPTFEAKKNKLEWFLAVQGDIARWPDVDDEFPVTLLAGDESAEVFHEGLADPELLEGSGFRLGLRGGRRSFRPGESIDGVAAWSLESAPRSAEVRLFWFTEGKGTTDVGVIRTETFSAMQPQDARPFRFDLPQGPLSFDGRLVSVKWAIEFVADSGRETVLHWDLVVSPTGRPLTLQAVTVDPKRKKSSFRFARS